MDILPFHFRTLQLCGMWYEDNRFVILKIIYRITAMFVVFTVIIGQFIRLITMQDNIDDLSDNLFITLTFISFCLKILNFIIRRHEMEDLLHDFRLPVYQSRSFEEEKIILEYSNTAKNIFFFFLCITQISGIILLIMPILISTDNVFYLPYKTYRPYSTSNISFWITYAMQVFTSFYGISLNVSLDTMTYGFIILTVGQFKINSYRLINCTLSIKDFIIHHKLIQNTAIKIESFFICVIVPHFFFTLLVICCSIFQISQKPVASYEFFTICMYIICILWEIFFYCWFGNELGLQSQSVADSLYSSKWLSCTTQEKRNLWLAMLYAQSGSNISFHGQCTLSLRTFLWIIKTSYALFSLLKQISN
ncbi:PREDICTED: odorant receptor 46a, isoform A-like [Ceratosolen solmsi marchali]|uniref:Odorant receptor n=1 Tax=Ceratosolen solmsi marchali TaxID=326594 RepID=A0AAJ6YF91_9HYME|nr:PREDICTED: odorant receptor 46a, isoform A-like [Ceratosolen solmsi marchali]